MSEAWLAFPVGILIATAASSVGIGGGILWMPFLLIVMKLRPDAAVYTSLLIQSVGMASGTVAYARKRQIDMRLALFLLMVAVPGLAAGGWATTRLTADHLELFLGMLTLTTAFLFVSAHQEYAAAGLPRIPIQQAKSYAVVVSAMAVASGMLSVSIGEWLIPLLRSRLNLRMHTAVATSITTIFGTCLLGALIHWILGAKSHPGVLLWALPGVLVGGQLGPRLMERIQERRLKEVFVFLLTLIGIHLIYNSY
ncbi:MAG: sulfite exporter TauE/SafE family protein [Desulfosarcinaceae bacterium]|nr:sulfite exporter TauE/SafE family protein [Desulfosarcinaceae bacterium]